MPNLYVFRGLPGSGKTTAANKLGCIVISGWDMFCMRDGKYCYPRGDAEKYDQMHPKKIRWETEILKICFSAGIDVAVAEVLPLRESVLDILQMADRCFDGGYTLLVRDMPCTVDQSLQRNTHGLTRESLEGFDQMWQPWNCEN